MSQFQRLLILAVWLLNYRRYLACGLGKIFPSGKEYNEGEYLVLNNKSGTVSSRSGIDLDLSAYTLHAGDDSLPLTYTLAAGERIILGFGENAAEFAQLVALPAEWEP